MVGFRRDQVCQGQLCENWRQGLSLSRINWFSLGPNEEGSKRGVTVLEGAGILARGTRSCT